MYIQNCVRKGCYIIIYYDGTEQLEIGKEKESGQYRDRVITHHISQPVSVPIAKAMMSPAMLHTYID